MSKGFFETTLKQLMEDYKRFEEDRLNNSIVSLVRLYAEEYKKRTELENGIKEVIKPYFDEDKKMPEDLVEAVKKATEKKYVSFSLPVTEGMPVSEIQLMIQDAMNKCSSIIGKTEE